MTVTTPLTQQADADAAAAGALVASLAARLAALDATLATARQDALTQTTTLTDLRRTEAELRARLGTAPLPADADQLTEQLELVLVAEQAAAAAAAAAADALDAANRDRARVATRLAAAQASAGAAVTTTSEVHADADRVASWRTALTTPPVSTALSGADAVLTSAPCTDARDTLFEVLDKPLAAGKAPDDAHPYGRGLFAALAARAVEATARLDAVVDARSRARAAVLAHAGSVDPLGAAVGRTLVAREARVAELGALAIGAVPAQQAAVATFARLAARTGPNAAEQGRMDGYHDAALAAADKQLAVFTAATDLRGTRAAFDAAVLDAQGRDPAFDPEASDAVKTQREAVAAAIAVLSAAEAAFTAVINDLDLWEAALPGDLKDDVLAFLDADAVLRRQADVDPAALLTALGDADSALAVALTARSAAARSTDLLANAWTERDAAATAAAAVAADRRAALVRGEG